MLALDSLSENCVLKLAKNLKLMLNGKKPVILCVGTQKVVGDSLGPCVGSLLVEKYKIKTIVYGLNDFNVNAKNLLISKQFVETMHRDRLVIAVDAALGKSEDIGQIQLAGNGLYPGSATNKNLPCVGDISLKGIVNRKGLDDMTTLLKTKVSEVSVMAEVIAKSLVLAIEDCAF